MYIQRRSIYHLLLCRKLSSLVRESVLNYQLEFFSGKLFCLFSNHLIMTPQQILIQSYATMHHIYPRAVFFFKKNPLADETWIQIFSRLGESSFFLMETSETVFPHLRVPIFVLPLCLFMFGSDTSSLHSTRTHRIVVCHYAYHCLIGHLNSNV
jgi:hypothetical protein